MAKCIKCGAGDCVKNGNVFGTQRYKCRQFWGWVRQTVWIFVCNHAKQWTIKNLIRKALLFRFRCCFLCRLP